MPSGSIDLGDAGPEVAARLAEILDQFDQADRALPDDFAEYGRLQDEAIAELEELLGSLDVAEVEDEAVEETDTEPA